MMAELTANLMRCSVGSGRRRRARTVIGDLGGCRLKMMKLSASQGVWAHRAQLG